MSVAARPVFSSVVSCAPAHGCENKGEHERSNCNAHEKSALHTPPPMPVLVDGILHM